MAGERSQKILGRVLRNIKEYGKHNSDVQDPEIYGEMNNGVNHIISESNPDKEITVTFKEDQADYPLTTETVTDPSLYSYDNNIASVKIIRQPTSWTRPLMLLRNKEFTDLINNQVSWVGIVSLYGTGGIEATSYIVTGAEIQGVKNGVNTSFALPEVPTSDSEEIFFNGVRQTRDVDYSIVNAGITWLSGIIPNTIAFGHYQDDVLVCNYIKNSIFGSRVVSTHQPLIATIINKRLKVYPTPNADYEDVEITLMVYLKSSSAILSDLVNPETDKEYDKALELYATAQFLIGNARAQFLNEFKVEEKRLRPIQNRKSHDLQRPSILLY